MVTYFDTCEILEMLSEASVKVFLDGGWGVDALIGRETRIHNDIDLFVEKKDYGKEYIRDYLEGIQRSCNGLYDR